MCGFPVTGDIDATGEPHAVMRFAMFDKSLERADPPRPAAQAAMEPDIHHARHASFSFGIQRIERVSRILIKRPTPVEAGRRGEAMIVHVGGVGHQ